MLMLPNPEQIMPFAGVSEREEEVKPMLPSPYLQPEDRGIVAAFRALQKVLESPNRKSGKQTIYQAVYRPTELDRRIISAEEAEFVRAIHHGGKIKVTLSAFMAKVVPVALYASPTIFGRLEAKEKDDMIRAEIREQFKSKSFKTIVEDFQTLLAEMRAKRAARRAETDRIIASAEKTRLRAEAILERTRRTIAQP